MENRVEDLAAEPGGSGPSQTLALLVRLGRGNTPCP